MARVLEVDRQHPSAEAARVCAEELRRGGVIIYPTETVYGFGANCMNRRAIQRIVEIKGRDEGKGMLLLIPGEWALTGIARHVPQGARRLMNAFWPGPLALILRARHALAPELTGHRGTIGVRISPEPFCRELLRCTGFPITSTSVNLSGEPPLQRINDIRDAFADSVDMIVDTGDSADARPSTVVDCTRENVCILREGQITQEQLEAVLQTRVISRA